MRVCILGFGSVWRRRWAKGSKDPRRFVRAAYYNTTGVMVNGKLHTRPAIKGHVRFNGAGGFDPNSPARMIGRVFECEDPCVWRGQNKILFKTLLPRRAEPDRYLVVTRAAELGHLRVGELGWCTADVWVIALSESHDDQEAMLLMVAGGTIRASVGTYRLKQDAVAPWRAALELELGGEG
ncbi:MAG: hypothetical protein M1404_05240 [Acidobacteria bacterium]|nr:hypothetical protein [Acidobacteriota bacterium]